MKKITCLFATILIHLLADEGLIAQPAALILTRQEWMSQLSQNTPTPLVYAFYSQMLGINLTGGTVTTPVPQSEPLPMTATTESLMYARFFPPITDTLQSGAERLEAEFPTGTYQLTADYTLGILGPRSSTYPIDFTSSFPETKPVIDNLLPLKPIESTTQTFQWADFNGSGDDFILFVLLEGNLSQEMIADLQKADSVDVLGKLQEYLQVVYPESVQAIPTAKLPPTQTSVTVSGLATDKDHVAVLLYNKVQVKQTGLTILTEQVGSVSGNVIFYPRITNGFWGYPVDLGLRYSEKMGFYYDNLHPWHYHYGMGWVFSAGNRADNLWLYNLDLGWIWTSENSYPYIYSLDKKMWGYNTPGASSPRQYIFLINDQWVVDEYP